MAYKTVPPPRNPYLGEKLEDLYARWSALNELILSLERYHRMNRKSPQAIPTAKRPAAIMPHQLAS